MAIDTLLKGYFQKSRIFMYPLLDIRRGVSVTPIQTYISWNGYYKPDDSKLSCLYYLRGDPEFQAFEKAKLLGNRLFHDFKEVRDDGSGSVQGVYTFDFGEYAVDWIDFIRGRYSMMGDQVKKKIKQFYDKDLKNSAYIESFLHPEKYYEMYAEILTVDIYHLKKVGQLCTPPDMEKERLDIPVKNLESITKNA